MAVQVQLPPGCNGFTMQDGTNYGGKAGTHVTVKDEHAPYIRRQAGGDAGLVGHGSFRALGLGTKGGRWCGNCRFLAQAWSKVCPKCGGETVPESEMPESINRPSLPSACPAVVL